MLREIKKVSVAGDMAAGLRLIANEIEAGAFPDARFAVTVVVLGDGTVTVWSHGAGSVLEITGALTRAANLDLRAR